MKRQYYLKDGYPRVYCLSKGKLYFMDTGEWYESIDYKPADVKNKAIFTRISFKRACIEEPLTRKHPLP